MTTIKYSVSRTVTASILLGLVACGQDASQHATEENTETPETARSGIVPEEAQVPDTMFGENHCVSPLPEPDGCAWGAQADAVVVASITSLNTVTRPAMQSAGDGTWRVVDNCSFANPAFSIGLHVERVLSGEEAENVVLSVGRNQVQRFAPLPTTGDDGDSVEWIRSAPPNRGPLRVGQRVVVAMHRIPQGWSLKGDTILGIDSNGTVHAPGRLADCLSTEPTDLDGLSVDAVAAKLACSPDPVEREMRRSARESQWGDPVSTYATICSDPTPGAVVDLHEPEDVTRVEDTGGPEPLPHP
jgi:hypothetical protein